VNQQRAATASDFFNKIDPELPLPSARERAETTRKRPLALRAEGAAVAGQLAERSGVDPVLFVLDVNAGKWRAYA
jgi:hypothetical protein